MKAAAERMRVAAAEREQRAVREQQEAERARSATKVDVATAKTVGKSSAAPVAMFAYASPQGSSRSLTEDSAGEGQLLFPTCHMHALTEEHGELLKAYRTVAGSHKDGVLRAADLLW